MRSSFVLSPDNPPHSVTVRINGKHSLNFVHKLRNRHLFAVVQNILLGCGRQFGPPHGVTTVLEAVLGPEMRRELPFCLGHFIKFRSILVRNKRKLKWVIRILQSAMIRGCWHVAIIFAGRLSLPAICHNNCIQIEDKLLGLTVLLFSSETLAPTLTTKLQSARIVVDSLMLVVSFMLVNAESSDIGCVLN